MRQPNNSDWCLPPQRGQMNSMSLSPDWINHTYQFKTLSRVFVLGIPIEEFVFWFLAGLIPLEGSSRVTATAAPSILT